MKVLNAGKCLYICLGGNTKNVVLNFNDRIYAGSINSYRSLNLINMRQCYKQITNDRTLSIALDSNINSFLELLSSSQKAPSNITNNHRNIQLYITELFKIVHNLLTSLMENFSVIGNNYWNLRGFQQFLIERKRTIPCGLKTMKYSSPLLWSLLPEAGKMSATLHEFRSKVNNLACYNILTGFVKLTFH